MSSVTHVGLLQLKIFKRVSATRSMKRAGKCQNDPTKGKEGVKINCYRAEEDG